MGAIISIRGERCKPIWSRNLFGAGLAGPPDYRLFHVAAGSPVNLETRLMPWSKISGRVVDRLVLLQREDQQRVSRRDGHVLLSPAHIADRIGVDSAAGFKAP